LSDDWGLLGRALRAVGKHREDIGAKSVKEGMVKEKKSKPTKTTRQKKIDDDIRKRRLKRKKARMEVEGGYIE